MSNIEKLGWRDQRISEFHRSLGKDFPAVDCDLILCEFDKRRPTALIEYKHENFAAGGDVNLQGANFDVLAALATAASIPFFVVLYSDDCETFSVWPRNARASQIHPAPELLFKQEFAAFLSSFKNFRQ